MQIFRRERGQVTVELMLILPVFLLVIFFVLRFTLLDDNVATPAVL